MRSIIAAGFLLITLCVQGQDLSAISDSTVSRIEKTLAADDMQGRQVFTPGIEKAAAFIVGEFKQAGLQPLPGVSDYYQHFVLVDANPVEASARLDGISVGRKNIMLFSADSVANISNADGYHKIIVKDLPAFNKAFYEFFQSNQNVIVLVDTSLSKRFARLTNFHIPQFEGSGNRLFILTSANPQEWQIQFKQQLTKKPLANLIGMIPGKSRPEEYVIFSAHYDHLGVGKPDATGDSIYNGANDDASGTTAVITLAKYFSKIHNNQRTLLFAAFTAEEVGELGSSYFSRVLDPDKVVAMLNIEMIGTESKWGKNSAYITGYEKSDLGTIMQKNLANSPFHFYPDPYPEQMLFLRSDNATLAKKGVPAHTISTSKMDSEKYYHTRGDAVETLDLQNMTEIIRALVLSSTSLVSGLDTPQRVKPE